MRLPVLALFLCFATLGLAQENEPTFPASPWKRLDPATVEMHPDFSKFGDVYSGATEAWKAAPTNVVYGAKGSSKTLGDIQSEVQGVKEVLLQSSNFESNNDNGALIKARLLSQLDALLTALEGHIDQNPQARADWSAFRTLIRFDDYQLKDSRWDGTKIQGATKAVVSSNTILFAGQTSQIVLNALQGGGPASLEANVPFVYFATLPQAIETRAVARRIREIFVDTYTAQISVAIKRLGDLNQGWDNYLSHGFSQYPWEALVNSHFSSYSWSRPPRWQWVLAHPELATVADIRRSGDTSIESAVAIHGLGVIHYFGDKREWFLGASGTIALTNESDFGLGVGPTIHFGHSGIRSYIPHVSVSLLWHDFEDGGDGPVVGLSVDLWQLLNKEDGPGKLFQDALRN